MVLSFSLASPVGIFAGFALSSVSVSVPCEQITVFVCGEITVFVCGAAEKTAHAS